MRNDFRFALCAIRKNIQGSAELRASFMMNIIGMAVNNVSFLVIWMFFAKSIGDIGGWEAIDILALEGFSCLSFGTVFSLAFGIIKLPQHIANGSFDSFLISPKRVLLRLAVSSFQPSAIGDVIFGLICLVVYALVAKLVFLQALIGLFLIVVASLTFLAVALAISAIGFFFSDPYPVTGSLFELFITPSLFHGGAFQGSMRAIFTFLVPSLVVGALPAEIMKAGSWTGLLLLVALSLAWFGLSLWLFRICMRRYESTNLMTFGN